MHALPFLANHGGCLRRGGAGVPVPSLAECPKRVWPGRCLCCPTSTRGLPRTPTLQGAALLGRLRLAQPCFHEESHFGYVTTACGRVPCTCTDVRRRSTPSSREVRRSSATATTCTDVAVARPEGGSQVDLLPRRLPVRQAESSRDFRSHHSGIDGLLWLGTLGVFGA